jgi:predicted transcriptional regulator
MNATDLTFGTKEVVEIVIGILSIAVFLYAMKRAAEKTKDKLDVIEKDLQDLKKDTEEKFLHAKNAKKANIQTVMESIQKQKEEVDKKEQQIYTRISEIRQEQQDAHEKLWVKLDGVEKMQFSMNTALAELTGYLKAKSEPKD